MVIFFVLLSITLVIIVLLQCRLTLGFSFKMEGTVCSAFITIYIFGRHILKNIMIYPANKTKKKDKAKKVKKKRDLTQLKVSLKVLTKLFKRSLILKDFKLYVKEGTGDAGKTAILYGVLWNLTALIPLIIFNDYNVKNKEIKIEPSFNEKIFYIDFNCIFSLKLVNIILMCKEFLIEYLKIKKGGDDDVRSSNRRSNDYSHAEH